MSWAYGHNAHGREVGYAVKATCDEPGCTAEIDRGLSWVCGGEHDGGEYGCGGYFCAEHLHFSNHPVDFNQFCFACCKEIDEEGME